MGDAPVAGGVDAGRAPAWTAGRRLWGRRRGSGGLGAAAGRRAGGDARHQGLHRGVHSRRALRARRCEFKGINVNLRKDIGSTEVIDKELQSGAIDGYPEYLGVGLTVAAGQDDAGSTAEETYDLAKEFYASRGQAISEQTSFENVDAIATTQYFAQRRGLATVGDLKRAVGLHARRPARVRGQTAGPGRHAGHVWARQREVQGGPDRRAVPGARPQRDRGRQRVHHGRPARERELQGARGRRAGVRLPARGAGDRRGEARAARRQQVHAHHQRRQRPVDHQRDDPDEPRRRGGRPGPGGGGRSLPENGGPARGTRKYRP